MAYSVNWTTKVITVPVSDLTLVSGVNYTLDSEAFWREMRRLEWEFSEGLYAPQAIEFVETQILSGLAYSPIVKLINGYTWQTNGSNINVSLIGYNSNLLDFFNPGNGVSVLANNSAGRTSDGTLSDKVDELWKLQGLDANNPMTVTPTARSTGSISQTISGDGTTTSTVTRN